MRRSLNWILTVSCTYCLLQAPALADHPPLAKAPFNEQEARSLQQRWAKHLDQNVVETNSLGMKMVLVPPGEFRQGASKQELDSITREIQQDKGVNAGMKKWSIDHILPYEGLDHPVRLTKPYRVSAHEVTVGQFRKFVEATGYKTDAETGIDNDGKPPRKWNWRNITPPGEYKYDGDRYYTQKDDEPVCHISWSDANTFCKWLSKNEGREYRLPTEAEWEHACRAGSQTRWHFGDNPKLLGDYAWYGANSEGKYHSVGTKKPNAFGLHDMIGNVYEWCEDFYGASYYKRSPVENPPGPETSEEPNVKRPDVLRHVLRGAASDAPRWYLRSAYRVRAGEHANHHSHLGFRIVRTLA